MNAHERGGLGVDCPGKVPRVGAVGRAYLHQRRAALAQHIGNAKAAADLHQLTAADDHLPPLTESGQRKKDGRGVVVDDERVLRAGQYTQQSGGVGMTATPLPGFQVILQRAVALSQVDDLGLRRLAERASAQIRVNDHTGGVDDGAQGGCLGCDYAAVDPFSPLFLCGGWLPAVDGVARGVELRTRGCGDRAASVFCRERGDLGTLQQLVHRWQSA